MIMQSISYDGVEAGITNQKIALIGLAHKALREKRSLVAPPLVIYDQITNSRERVDIFDVLTKDIFISTLESFSIKLCDDLYEPIDGWQCFLEGADRFGEVLPLGEIALDNLTCQLTRSLRPNEAIINISNKILSNLCSLDVDCSVQMRIEKDWQSYSENVLNSFNSENNLPTASDILNKIVRKFGSSVKSAYVLCDERAMPVSKQEIREMALLDHGIKLYWKSDFIDIHNSNSLIQSLIDFEVAMGTKYFIGTSRSTFSCFVTFEKYAKTRNPIRGHYIYNSATGDLEERFDNGNSVDSKIAIAKTWNRPDLLEYSKQDIPYNMTLLAHVSNIGEYISKSSIIQGVIKRKLVAGDATQPEVHRIEGFSIIGSNDAPILEYQSDNIYGYTDGWVCNGSYTGTRGQNAPLKAFAIRIDGPARIELDCVYAGLFSDSDEIIFASNGEKCISKSGNGFLLCMQILIKSKNIKF
ncbi:O-fucosyltransferase family protein [Gluconobacter japonicus]|uniref:O-fucosyltransferase family protein n=1 Tax=Gluconobacter japonicus TaxID=376620 RepID=UPI003D2C0C38